MNPHGVFKYSPCKRKLLAEVCWKNNSLMKDVYSVVALNILPNTQEGIIKVFTVLDKHLPLHGKDPVRFRADPSFNDGQWHDWCFADLQESRPHPIPCQILFLFTVEKLNKPIMFNSTSIHHNSIYAMVHRLEQDLRDNPKRQPVQ